MSLRLLLRLSAVVVLAVALAGCGGDDSGGSGDDGGGSAQLTADEQAFVDGSVESFDASDDGLTEDDARCIATSVVQGVGLDQLDDLGITPKSFNESDLPPLEAADAEEVVDRIEGCMDLRELMLTNFDRAGELPKKTQDCLGDVITDDLAHDLMVGSMTGNDDEALGKRIATEIAACPGFGDVN